MKPTPVIAQIVSAIERLTGEGGNRNRVALTGANGHVVFSSVAGASAITVEVSAGGQLPKGFTLEPADYARLDELGLRRGRASENLRAEFTSSVENRTLWARHAVTILGRTFGVPAEAIAFRARYEQVETLDNRVLRDAMLHLAKTRAWAARKGVYLTLIRARLVWALAAPLAPGAPLGEAAPHVCGTLGGRPSVAVFPDYEALDRYAPTGLDARVATGRALFPVFAALGVGSVMINPGGTPRGELYTNEVLTVVDGIKRLSGVH